MMKIFSRITAVVMIVSLTGCSFSVKKKDAYLLNSDTKRVTEVELSKLNDTELKYALEEIYARHGKIFEDDNLSRYFTSQKWYAPNPSYTESDLSPIEAENAEYIELYIDENCESQQETEKPSLESQTSEIDDKPIIIYTDDYYYKQYYASDRYIIPYSSSRYLTAYELRGLSSSTLALIRNEIYARHGYIFQKEKYKKYFGSMSWYYENPYFKESDLNSYERRNVELIKSLE